ncbi:hypothetical protein [Streptosporangium sp. NPDC051022]|uniref:hypothetical protein n=1 Tax=Streptosporangium sp. NPDC051022 TaxID=3155752 RepID=UPI003448C06E
MKKTLLCEVAGVVETAPERVERLVLAVSPGPVGPGNAWLFSSHGGTVEGGPERFVLRMPAHAMTVEVTGSTLATQGGWWYRGEYTVEPHSDGALVTYRVFNVASWGRWGVPLANRLFIGFARWNREGFAAALGLIGQELDCGTRLL